MVLQKNIRERNLNWPQIPDLPYRMLINDSSGSAKINSLLNLISHQPDIDKIYSNAEDSYEEKYQFLITQLESTGLNHFNNPKAFIEYSVDMDDIYKNIEECNSIKERKILIVFDDVIPDMFSNKKT